MNKTKRNELGSILLGLAIAAVLVLVTWGVIEHPVRTFDIKVSKTGYVQVPVMRSYCSVIWDENGNSYDMNEFPELYESIRPGQRWRITTKGINIRFLKRSWITDAIRLDKEPEQPKLRPGAKFVYR